MYIDIVPNRNSKPAILLRCGWREGENVRKKTLANLSHWPREKVDALRAVLRGQPMVPLDTLLTIQATTPHGHVEAVLAMIKKLKLPKLLGARSRQRNLVLAMIVARILHPASKLATTRLWHTTTLAELLEVQDASAEDLYDALDWLHQRQARIEKKLAKRHLSEGACVLYDVTSSYYEGKHCTLAQFGYGRDQKKGRPIIVYGVLSDRQGRPVAMEVYPGSTADPTTVPDQVTKIRQRFALERVVLVGDRGMLTNTQIDQLRKYPGLGWLSSLRSPAIRKLVETEAFQPSLFDHQNLAEITAPEEFPGERLVVCFNPVLAEHRRHKREDLLKATEQALERIVAEAKRRTKKPLTDAQIGAKAGRVLARFKVAKHLTWKAEKGRFTWERNDDSIVKEALLDGIYVLRTSETAQQLDAQDTVRTYKRLAQVEQAFRCIKTVDLHVRPIFHRTVEHVKAHIFLCMLAYYVDWHLREAWAPLLFEEEDLELERTTRDPVAPAQPSDAAKEKKAQRLTPDGFTVHSFDTLIAALGTRCKNLCTMTYPGTQGATLERFTEPTPLQARALELIDLFPVTSQ